MDCEDNPLTRCYVYCISAIIGEMGNKLVKLYIARLCSTMFILSVILVDER